MDLLVNYGLKQPSTADEINRYMKRLHKVAGYQVSTDLKQEIADPYVFEECSRTGNFLNCQGIEAQHCGNANSGLLNNIFSCLGLSTRPSSQQYTTEPGKATGSPKAALSLIVSKSR